MDLLVEKLDGSRYYLSQYKVLITDFEESAPSVTRNNMQLDQRNGNIDFGGWHTDKTINITGYYRADDIDEEEMLREKLYALLSDPDGYYITQLKTTPSVAMERPGETSGGYYDKLSDYPSHKRFLVYTEAPEMELVGNVNGTLLYKLTAEFKTMKLPYGESMPQDLDVKPNVPYYFSDVGLKRDSSSQGIPGKPVTDGKTPYLHTAWSWSSDGKDRFTTSYPGYNLFKDSGALSVAQWQKSTAGGNADERYNGHVVITSNKAWNGIRYMFKDLVNRGAVKIDDVLTMSQLMNNTGTNSVPVGFFAQVGSNSASAISYPNGVQVAVLPPNSGWKRIAITFKVTALDTDNVTIRFDPSVDITGGFVKATEPKLEMGENLSPVYTPAPSEDPINAYPKFIGTYTDYIAEDSTDPSKYTWALIKVEDGNDGLSGYNKWYFDTYYSTKNLAIPYAGTVPCNQLEQGFAIEFTAKEASSSLSFKIDDTELTYSGAVASGDVFLFSGFSYTQNGLSIVSKTNKAYFILQPDKPNRITCNVPGTVRIIGFQNLYA